jgi:hypothetical protein
VQQLDAKPLFEFADLAADRRLRLSQVTMTLINTSVSFMSIVIAPFDCANVGTIITEKSGLSGGIDLYIL